MCKLFEIEHLAERIYLLYSTLKDLHAEIESRVEYAPLQYIEMSMLTKLNHLEFQCNMYPSNTTSPL